MWRFSRRVLLVLLVSFGIFGGAAGLVPLEAEPKPVHTFASSNAAALVAFER